MSCQQEDRVVKNLKTLLEKEHCRILLLPLSYHHFHTPRAWVAEPFSKWGGTNNLQKSTENFCGLHWQL